MFKNESEMYPYVKRNLRRKYPQSERWEIFHEDNWVNYKPDFVIERRGRGLIQRIICEVKLNDIKQNDIDQINKYVKNLSGGNVRIRGKILYVLAGTDVELVPDDIEIHFLRYC
jgi:hypothetical protein